MVILAINAMDRQKNKWMERNSILVDCINMELRNASVVHKDLAV